MRKATTIKQMRQSIIDNVKNVVEVERQSRQKYFIVRVKTSEDVDPTYETLERIGFGTVKDPKTRELSRKFRFVGAIIEE